MEWRPAGLSVCMLLLIFPCTVKFRSSLLAPAHRGGPGKRAVERMWCGCGAVSLEQMKLGDPYLGLSLRLITVSTSVCVMDYPKDVC